MTGDSGIGHHLRTTHAVCARITPEKAAMSIPSVGQVEMCSFLDICPSSKNDALRAAIVYLSRQIPVCQATRVILRLLSVIRIGVVLTVFLKLHFVPLGRIWVLLRPRAFPSTHVDLALLSRMSQLLRILSIRRVANTIVMNDFAMRPGRKLPPIIRTPKPIQHFDTPP